MPETNGLKQVLYGDAHVEINGGDDVEDRTIFHKEQEFEEPSLVEVDHHENGEFSSVEVDYSENGEKVKLSDSDTVENGHKGLIEDSGENNTFVDCPDELIVSNNSGVVTIEETTKQSPKDNANTEEAHVHDLVSDKRDRGVMTIEETKQSSEDNVDTKEADVYELDNGIQDDTKEAHVRELDFDNRGVVTIEETKQSSEDNDDTKDAYVHELDNGKQDDVVVHSPHEVKDENVSLLEEFANLRHQLKALSSQQPLNIENEETQGMWKSLSIHDTANECSKLVKNAVEERLHMEGELRKLQSSLRMKDQEIEYLHVKISELSVSQNVVLALFGFQNQNSSDLSNPSTEVQYGLQSIDDSINRMLASLVPTVNADGLSDESITGRMSFVEQNVSQLNGNYQNLLSEIELLRQSLTEVSSDFNVEDFWTTTAVARNALLELKRKEVDFGQHISNLEEKNKKVNADIEKLQEELEQEKTRYANTKEKLSMAVTKGKALVQQKDSLKQSLTEKTVEIEKCLAEIEKKVLALEGMDILNEKLVTTENLAASLQKEVSEKDNILSKCEEILYQTSVNHELESSDIMERIRRLEDEKNTMAGVMMEYNKLEDVLSSIDFPEDVSSSYLESRVSWLVESFTLSKGELGELQDEIARSSEVARDKIESLTVSLLDETQEKNFIREELERITHKYQEIVKKESQLSVEKNRIVSLLLEASGTEIYGKEEAEQPGSELGLLIDRCFSKIKARSSTSYTSSGSGEDVFEKLQTHLFIKDQELMLCEELLEEDTQIRLKVNTLANELGAVSHELQVLKDEKSALERDLEHSNEKTSLLREKLSMAVKKGKGLAQDRENLKKLMDEKSSEIDKLKLKLQQQESALDDFKNQIDNLSANVELIPKLEVDLNTMKDQKDQLQQFLMESNNMMQRVMESIDGSVFPVDVTFEEPVDKVMWAVRYLNECQDAKTFAEKEFDNLKVEFDSLSSKLTEAYTAKSSLEEALSFAENSISKIKEENSELSEVCATRKSLEDALSEAESKISVLVSEKNDAQLSKAAVDTELEKVKEEVSTQTTRLAEAYRTINSLKDALFHLETNVSLLSKENNDSQVDRSNLEDEMKKLKEEAESQSSKFLDATSTIRSLEDNLSKLVREKENVEEEIAILKEEAESQSSKFLDATSTIRSLEDNLSVLVGEKENVEEEILKLKEEAESQSHKLLDATSTITSLENNLSKLVGEKKIAEEEISLLISKLNACMEELSGLGGSSENRSVELFSHLHNLQLLSKDETLLSLLRQSFEVKFQSLKDMDLLLRDINEHLVQMGSDSLPSSNAIEEDSCVNIFTTGFDNFATSEIDKDEDNAEGGDNFESHFRRAVEGISSRNRTLADRIQGCSTSMDEFIAYLLKNFQAARDEIVCKLGQVRSLEQKANDLETSRDTHKLEIDSLEKDVNVLFSACTVTAQELENEVENYQVELSSVPELKKWTNLLFEVREVRPAENLLMAAQKVCALTRQLERERNDSADVIKVLEYKMTESKATAEDAIEERDLLQARLCKLENDLEVMRSSHQEMSFKVEDYQAKKTTLSDREAEILSLRKSLTVKEKEADDALLVASQITSLYDMINDFDIASTECNVGDTEIHESDHLKKLSHVIDVVASMRRQMNILSQDKETLQSAVENQAHQIENLEKEIEEQGREKDDLENIKTEMFEVELGIKNIIYKLGGNDLVGEQKSDGVRGLFTVLEKLVTAIILEYDNTKSRAQELGVKLHGSQKVVDELSGKVKSLETSSQGRSPSSDGVGERSIFEAPPLPTRSEITELEDVASIGKKAVGSSPSAPHARPLRKGSYDHLAINIDSESDRLIKDEENDEDKGKVFKSLNTSGLIPKQGKVFADRVDGFWVSGDRALMARPRVRLGLIAYWLLLHIWLLGTIL